jgi:hypothetical protein
VFAGVADPIGSGFIASLARRGGMAARGARAAAPPNRRALGR